MSELYAQTMNERILTLMQGIEEAPFWPTAITEPYEELIAAESFTDLMLLFNPASRHQIDKLENNVSKFHGKYMDYRGALYDTPNVFSAEVDFI